MEYYNRTLVDLLIRDNSSRQDAEQDRILENVTLCAMAESHVNVLKKLPRLSSTNISNMLPVLGDPHLLFTVIRWSYSTYSSTYTPGPNAVAKFLLHTYTFDLSVRDASGKNALALAAERGMHKVVGLILEEQEDLLNSQDHSGRTPLSWAIERSTRSVKELLEYEGIQSELADDEGLAPIDHVLQKHFDTATRLELLPLMIPSLEHKINRLDRHGCTVLHMLIDTSYSKRSPWWAEDDEHWEKLERYEGRKIFECREEWEHEWNKSRHPRDSEYYIPRLNVSVFRAVLDAASVSAAEVRSSPCKCGIGTIFLAISTENVELVEVLLEFYPDLVNDQFFDGSSPLDLASCIRDQQRRQSMIDLILIKNLIVEIDTPRSDISESDSGDEEQDWSLADLKLNQRQKDRTTNETDDE